jgi:hypothetical protein
MLTACQEHKLKCPRCGRYLVIPDAAVLNSETAPWLCVECHRGYHESELDRAADYRRITNDWRYGDAELRQALAAEVHSAKLRGTHIREDRLSLLSDSQITLLLKRARSTFTQVVEAERDRRANGN